MLRVEHPLPGCVCLVMNRPLARNALSRELRQALVTTIDRLAGDASVRVLVLTGAGVVFCAGLDLKELAAATPAQREELFDSPSLDPIAALERFPGPVIGAVNGPAVTGGFELALACDVLLAAPEASFADTHARVGVLPGWGMSQKLSRIIGINRAREVSLAGAPLPAQRACEWGLVSRVLPAGELLPCALALAQDMLRAAPAVLPQYKQLINEGHLLSLAAALKLEKETAARQHESFDAPGIDSRGAQVKPPTGKDMS